MNEETLQNSKINCISELSPKVYSSPIQLSTFNFIYSGTTVNFRVITIHLYFYFWYFTKLPTKKKHSNKNEKTFNCNGLPFMSNTPR